jgi:hypothetical protein
MQTPITGWQTAVDARRRRDEELRQALADNADEKAQLITLAVAAYGRGGRRKVADELGVELATVDEALKRGRLCNTRVLATLDPQPAADWGVLAAALVGTWVDATWLEQPGELIAQEVEDVEEVPAGERRRVVGAARSWSWAQAVAVLDAVIRRAVDELPTVGEWVDEA